MQVMLALSQSGCFMWTGRAFHPESYIVQRRERDAATRLSKFIDIDESNQSTPRVLRSKLSEKRTTRTSGEFVEEERTMRTRGLVEEERTRTMGRATRARTAPVNVEALQTAEVAERNSGETLPLKYLLQPFLRLHVFFSRWVL